LLSLSLAEDKAYTAASFSRGTHEWDERLADQPKVQQALGQRDRFIMLGGGLPVMIPAEQALSHSSTGLSIDYTRDGEASTQARVLIGAVGVSGGSVHQDIECAQAAIDALYKP